MTNYDKREYLKTPKGQYSRYYWRKLRGRSYYFFEKEPQSKKSMKSGDKIKFQREILKLMLKSKRRSYTSLVVAELSLSSTLKNPPHIHTAVKNLLDIFGKPLPKSGIRRKGLIYQDDRKIAYLSVRYALGINKKSIRARFVPLNYLIQDLKLASDILSGEYADFYNCSDFQEKIKKIDGYYRDINRESSLDNLRNLIKDKDKYLRVFSEGAYQAMVKMERMSIQESILSNMRLKVSDLYLLYQSSTFTQSTKSNISPKSGDWICNVSSSLSEWVARSPIRIQLPSIPIREGDTNLFKDKVKKSLKKFLKEHKIYEPLYVPVNLEVIYKPPLASHNFFKDLDNIMCLILPIFSDVYKPPPTRISTINLNDIKDMRLFTSLKKMIDAFPKSVKHSVSGYDIFEIPRDSQDKGDGFITIGLSGGLSATNSHWNRIDQIIDEWIQCCKN